MIMLNCRQCFQTNFYKVALGQNQTLHPAITDCVHRVNEKSHLVPTTIEMSKPSLQYLLIGMIKS